MEENVLLAHAIADRALIHQLRSPFTPFVELTLKVSTIMSQGCDVLGQGQGSRRAPR